MRERGVVISASEGSVDVRVAAGSACEACGHCCRVDRDGLVIEGALDESGAAVGDEVEVEIPEEAELRAGVIAYVVPVVMLLGGYFAGAWFGGQAGVNGDAAGAVGAVIGVSAGLLLLRGRGTASLSEARLRPRVRAIIAPGLAGVPSSDTKSDDPDRGSKDEVET